MIVTRQMAEEAAAVFGFDISSGLLDAQSVNAAYRTEAKAAHPDAGGSVEEFAAVDRAKHVLLNWLERQGKQEPQTPGAGRVCHKCDGKGHIELRRAWRSLRVQCQLCRGTGCLDSEHEKGDQW